MTPVITIVGPVFLVMALGAASARFDLFPAEAQKAFSIYVFYCAMPCYLFLAMAHVPPDQVFRGDFLAAFATGMAGAAALGAAASRWLGRKGFGSCVLGMMSACQTNSVYIGVPIIVMAYGAPGPVIIISLFQVIVMTLLVLGLLELDLRRGAWSWGSALALPRIALLNPIVGACLLGLLLSCRGWEAPMLVERTCQLLGSAGIPTALFALGLSLGARRPGGHTDSGLIWGLVVVKSLIHPALTWLVGRYLFGLQDQMLGYLTLIAAMPTALNTYIFAQRYGVFVEASGRIILYSSLISVVTISALLVGFGATP